MHLALSSQRSVGLLAKIRPNKCTPGWGYMAIAWLGLHGRATYCFVLIGLDLGLPPLEEQHHIRVGVVQRPGNGTTGSLHEAGQGIAAAAEISPAL